MSRDHASDEDEYPEEVQLLASFREAACAEAAKSGRVEPATEVRPRRAYPARGDRPGGLSGSRMAGGKFVLSPHTVGTLRAIRGAQRARGRRDLRRC